MNSFFLQQITQQSTPKLISKKQTI